MQAPSADRRTLLNIAGGLWMLVGLGLLGLSIYWLLAFSAKSALLLIPGLAVGVVVYRFGFSALADANIERVNNLSPWKSRICVFAFQNVRSYIIAVAMMFIGYTLRHLPVPKLYLAPVYSIMGVALLLAGLRYFRRD